MPITLQNIGEFKLLEKISKIVTKRNKSILLGVGDDCAIVRIDEKSKEELLLKSDATIEEIHFKSNINPEIVGHKAIGRVLSDIAAMGGKPKWALVNLVARKSTKVYYIQGIYKGLKALADKYQTIIVGGDTSCGKAIELHITIIGTIPAGTAILRKGAKVGDLIYVTGTLGASIIKKHLNFEPRVKEGWWIRDNKIASAMIDISDGTLIDLKRICSASSVSAKILLDKLPFSEDAIKQHKKNKQNLIKSALTDGEDFELLLTVPKKYEDFINKKWPFKTKITQIGEIINGNGKVFGVDKDTIKEFELLLHGYEHFKS